MNFRFWQWFVKKPEQADDLVCGRLVIDILKDGNLYVRVDWSKPCSNEVAALLAHHLIKAIILVNSGHLLETFQQAITLSGNINQRPEIAQAVNNGIKAWLGDCHNNNVVVSPLGAFAVKTT